ncbi:MAG: hypothetical protein R3F34_05100 [Planctomycetota bacterium]
MRALRTAPLAALLLLALPATAAAQEPEVRLEAPSAEEWAQIQKRRPVDSALSTVVYDVSDLFDPTPPSEGGVELESDLTPEERAAHQLELRQDFVADAKRWMEPTFDGTWTLAATDGGLLVATLPSEAHTWMASWLDVLRRGEFDLADCSLRFFDAPPSTYDRLGIVDQTRVYETSQLPALLESGLEVITAPRLLAFMRQKCTVGITNQTAYVKDYELVVVAPGDQLIADPVIDVVQDGIEATLRVTPLPDGTFGLWMEASLSRLKRPIATTEVTLAEGLAPVTIGLPEVSTVKLRTRVVMRSGTSILLTGRMKYPDGVARSPFSWVDDTDGSAHECAILIGVKRVPLKELDVQPEDEIDPVPAFGERRDK